MARASMEDVIAEVRQLIFDPEGASEQFSDDDIEQACDLLRRDVFRLELRPAYEIASDGTVEQKNWFADGRWWEDDVVIQDGTHQVLTDMTTPALDDEQPILGQWTLDESYAGSLYLTGKQHDVYGAAADLLEMWSAAHKGEYDFLSLGRTFKRSQKAELFDGIIAKYRRRQFIRTSEMVRTDMNPWAPALW